MLLREYIRTIMSVLIKEDKMSGQQEVLSLFKRAIHDIGVEEISWFMRDKDWLGLTQAILEIVHYGVPNKPQQYLELINGKDYGSICKLIGFALEASTGQMVPCNPKAVEHFFYARKERGL